MCDDFEVQESVREDSDVVMYLMILLNLKQNMQEVEKCLFEEIKTYNVSFATNNLMWKRSLRDTHVRLEMLLIAQGIGGGEKAHPLPDLHQRHL